MCKMCNLYVTISHVVMVFQSLSCVWLCDPGTAAPYASLSFSFSPSLLKFMSIESVQWWRQPSHSLLPPFPPLSALPSIRGLFQWVSSSHQVTNVLELQHQSFQWIFRVTFLRIDLFELLAVQWTFKSLLQHYNLKASILRCSAFFMVQLSEPYMTTVKTTALFLWTFVGKVMSLLFNLLSGLVVAPGSKHLLIS